MVNTHGGDSGWHHFYSTQKHHTLVSALPTEVVLKVKDAIVAPPAETAFDFLKKPLLSWFKRPDHVYLTELQNLVLGDNMPSLLWEWMSNMNSRCSLSLLEPLLCQLPYHKLPLGIQLALATVSPSVDREAFLTMADQVCEHFHHHGPVQVEGAVSQPVGAQASQHSAHMCPLL